MDIQKVTVSWNLANAKSGYVHATIESSELPV